MIVLLLIFLYILAGAFTSTICYKVNKEELEDELGILIFIGVFWPIILIVILGIYLANKLHKRFLDK